MKRYTFLLLAFFLSMNVHAFGLGSAPAVASNVNSFPDRNPANSTTTPSTGTQGSSTTPNLNNQSGSTAPDTRNQNGSTTPDLKQSSVTPAAAQQGTVNGTTPVTDSTPATTTSTGVRRRSNGGATTTDVKRSSARNMKELGNIKESTAKAEQTADVGAPNLNSGTKTSSKNLSCKTYEGKVYDQGEAGYNDCIRTIKTERPAIKTVP